MLIMKCGSCSFNDGCCYTSMPPKVKCTITNEYHYYEDDCNCEEVRLSRDEELAMIKKMLTNKPFVGVDYGNLVGSDTITAAEAIDFNWSVNTESITATAVACTSCLVCGEDIILFDYEAAGPRVCSTCKKAIKFIKEKFKKELEEYEV